MQLRDQRGERGVCAAVEANGHLAFGSGGAHRGDEVWPVDARGAADPEEAEPPDERHPVGGDEVRVLEDGAEGLVVVRFHDDVDVGDADVS